MSRDVQVRVVFCDWLAWLLRMKRSGHDVTLKSLLDKNQTERRFSIEDKLSTHDTHLPIVNKLNKVLTTQLIKLN